MVLHMKYSDRIDWLSVACMPRMSVCLFWIVIIISPPENDSFRKDLCFSPDVFFIFLSTRDLRDAWADRREILHDGQY